MKIPREKLKKYFDRLNESNVSKERKLGITEEEKKVVFCNNLSIQEKKILLELQTRHR
jgi:hypothetical protein